MKNLRSGNSQQAAARIHKKFCNPLGNCNRPWQTTARLRNISKDLLQKYPHIPNRAKICSNCRKLLQEKILAQDVTKVPIINPAHIANETSRTEDLEEILQALKDKYKSLGNHDVMRTQILTLAPEKWSINKLSKEFATSRRQARKAKNFRKEHGVWPTIGREVASNKIPNTTIDAVVKFYEDDNNSNILPGRKDVVSIKKGNTREKVQKRLILYDMRKLHEKFKTFYPDMIISCSSFCKLRPQNMVLPGASGTHVQCVCTIHQNIILMLESILKELMDYGFNDSPQTYQHFIKKLPVKILAETVT